MVETIEAYGRTAAADHRHFAGAYRIVVSDRGTQIEGGSPDGRCTGTCDRCGVSIMNIYVFSDSARRSFMHVGCDCAQRMGVPVEELKKAHGYWSERRRECDRAAHAASAAERRAAEQAAKNARLAESAAIVEEFRAMAANPNATTWEREQCGRLEARIAANGADWIDAPSDKYEERAAESIGAIRTRLALCETSTEQAEAVTKKGKPSGFRRALRAYRDCISFTSSYGTTYISFLTDDAGNAFVHKGSNAWGLGEEVEATWSVDGTDVRDGLTATVLKRPRKIAKSEEEIAADAHQALVASWLESDRLLIANAVGVDPSEVHYANAGRGLYVVHAGLASRCYHVCPFDERPNGPNWEKSPTMLPASAGLVLWQGTEG